MITNRYMLDNKQEERELIAFELLWDGYGIKATCVETGLSVGVVGKINWEIMRENCSQSKVIYSKRDFGLPLDWQVRKRKAFLSSEISLLVETLKSVNYLISGS